MKISNQDYFEIDGVKWIKEDIKIKGNIYFTYDQALKIAKEKNCRLPTVKDMKNINKLQKEALPKAIYPDLYSLLIYKSLCKSDYISFSHLGFKYNYEVLYFNHTGYYWLESNKNELMNAMIYRYHTKLINVKLLPESKIALSLKLIKL